MLSNTQIKRLKPKDKKYLVADFDGLYIQVYPNGKKTFIFINTSGKRTKKTLGTFSPNFDLNKARIKLREIKDNANHIKISTKDVINEWLTIKGTKVAYKTFREIESSLSRSIKKNLGHILFCELKRKEIIDAINNTFGNKIETKRRVLNNMIQLYSYAVMQDYVPNNILFGISASAVFGQAEIKNFPTITNLKKIEQMFIKIVNSGAMLHVKLALFLNCLTALRPNNIISLRWTHIDFKNNLIVFQSSEMKTKKDFVLPLSSQALEILLLLKKYHYYNDYVFASPTSKTGHISDNTTRKLLRDLGITKQEFTPHGFRSMFSTLANENNKEIDTIERCLAHIVGGVRGVYDRSEKLEQKRQLMQWYADFMSPYLHLDDILY